jgi:hypothetical protein
MLETDLAKLPSIIADAHKALLDRIEETMIKPVPAEREELSDALSGLRCLRQELKVTPSWPASNFFPLTTIAAGVALPDDGGGVDYELQPRHARCGCNGP